MVWCWWCGCGMRSIRLQCISVGVGCGARCPAPLVEQLAPRCAHVGKAAAAEAAAATEEASSIRDALLVESLALELDAAHIQSDALKFEEDATRTANTLHASLALEEESKGQEAKVAKANAKLQEQLGHWESADAVDRALMLALPGTSAPWSACPDGRALAGPAPQQALIGLFGALECRAFPGCCVRAAPGSCMDGHAIVRGSGRGVRVCTDWQRWPLSGPACCWIVCPGGGVPEAWRVGHAFGPLVAGPLEATASALPGLGRGALLRWSGRLVAEACGGGLPPLPPLVP